MKKAKAKKLTLSKETVRSLAPGEVAGGFTATTCYCSPPDYSQACVTSGPIACRFACINP